MWCTWAVVDNVSGAECLFIVWGVLLQEKMKRRGVGKACYLTSHNQKSKNINPHQWGLRNPISGDLRPATKMLGVKLLLRWTFCSDTRRQNEQPPSRYSYVPMTSNITRDAILVWRHYLWRCCMLLKIFHAIFSIP